MVRVSLSQKSNNLPFLRRSAFGLFTYCNDSLLSLFCNISQLGEIVYIIWMLEQWRKNDDDDDDDDNDDDFDHMSNDV